MASQYLVWGLAGIAVVLILALAAIAVRRRLERGRPARFSVGLSVIDIVEGVSGTELSPKAQAMVVAVSVALGLMAVAIAIYFAFMQPAGAR